jgi:Transglutaminase-like superfamily
MARRPTHGAPGPTGAEPMKAAEQPALQGPRPADHVRVCQADDQYVLLDLDRSRYMSISHLHGRQLGPAVDGWPAGPGSIEVPTDVSPLIEQMLAQGLLSRVPAERMTQAAGPIEPAISSLDAQACRVASHITGLQLCRFASAAMLTALRLRCLSLGVIANRIARQKLARAAARHPQPEGLLRSVRAFDQMRPMAFTARDKCLHDSLALVTFLVWEGFHPAWVIGVKTNPFRAHSWVQAGGLVLNDMPENVRPFKPILVV